MAYEQCDDIARRVRRSRHGAREHQRTSRDPGARSAAVPTTNRNFIALTVAQGRERAGRRDDRQGDAAPRRGDDRIRRANWACLRAAARAAPRVRSLRGDAGRSSGSASLDAVVVHNPRGPRRAGTGTLLIGPSPVNVLLVVSFPLRVLKATHLSAYHAGLTSTVHPEQLPAASYLQAIVATGVPGRVRDREAPRCGTRSGERVHRRRGAVSADFAES